MSTSPRLSQVVMAAHGPWAMAYNKWAGRFHGRPGPCTQNMLCAHVQSPAGSIKAWSDMGLAPAVAADAGKHYHMSPHAAHICSEYTAVCPLKRCDTVAFM